MRPRRGSQTYEVCNSFLNKVHSLKHCFNIFQFNNGVLGNLKLGIVNHSHTHCFSLLLIFITPTYQENKCSKYCYQEISRK